MRREDGEAHPGYHLPHSTTTHGRRSFAVAWSTLRTRPRRLANGAGLSGAYLDGR